MVFAYLLETMNYAFALKFLGWNKIYCTRNFQVTPLTDGIYGPILDSSIGTKGVLAADYLPLLDPEFIKYGCSIDPVTQEMESTPATFRLLGDEDLIAEVVQVRGALAELDSTIAAPTSEAYLGSINVKSKGSAFPSGAQYIQIGQETWKVSSRTGNTFTVSQRGCFGSFQEKSVVTPQNPVYVTPIEIGQAGRGVELWIQVIGQNGEVVSLNTVWNGFVENTRLTDLNKVEVVCRDALSYLKNNSSNIHMIIPVSARSSGFDRNIVFWQLAQDIHTDGGGTALMYPMLANPYSTALEYYNVVNVGKVQFLDLFGQSIYDHLKLEHGGAWSAADALYKRAGIAGNGSDSTYLDNVGATPGNVYLQIQTLDSISDWSNGSILRYRFGPRKAEVQPTPSRRFAGGVPYHALLIDFDPEKFNSIQFIQESETSSQNRFIVVNNPYNSDIMAYLTESGNIESALLNNIMKSEAKIADAAQIYEDVDTQHVWMKLRGKHPTDSREGQRTVVYGPVVMDAISYVPETRGDYVLDFDEGLTWEYGTLVESKNYVAGLYHGYWKPYARMFVTDIEDRCSNAVLPIDTTSPLFRRFDVPSNTKTLGEELADNMKLFDYYFTYDSAGSITVRNFADDLASTTADIVLTGDDYIEEKPEFSQDSALINQVTIKSNGFLNADKAKNITDYFSIKRYGGKKSTEIDLTGTIFEARYFENSTVFDNLLMERYLRRFSGIRNLVTVKLPISFYTAEIGQTVQLTDWATPNQSGVIGGAGELYTLIGKDVDWSEGIVTLNLILFPFYKFEQGNIIPCARVEYFDGANVYLANDVMDTAGTMQDYSWSDDTAYPYTSGDRGVGWFSAGYKVVLTDRSSSVWYSEEFTVASVDPATYKITFTSTPGSYWTTAIDNGEIVDIHYSVADNVVTAQYPFTYIGDSSTGYVDTGLVNPNKKWRAS